MTKIIGLFEDEQDLACAIKGLYNCGFHQKEIEVINPNPIFQSRLMKQRSQRVAASVSPRFVDGVATTYNSPSKAKTELGSIAVDPTGMLTHMGVPEAEACFFAVNVKRGNRLVIVQTCNERALEAQHIIRQANARVSTGYE